MSVERFIADRITGGSGSKSNISGPIVKIGVTGIALGIAVMILTVSIVPGFKKEIIARITGLTTHIVISHINVQPGSEQEPLVISADTLARIAALPAVKQMQPSAFKNGLLKTEVENEGVLLKGVDSAYDLSFYKENLVSGRLPDFNSENASTEILLSNELALKLNIDTGYRIETHFISTYQVYDSLVRDVVSRSAHRSRRFTVCGIFKTGFSDFDKNLGIIDLRQVRRLNLWPENAAGSYEVILKDFKQLDLAAEQLRDILGYGYNVSTVEESYSNLFVWLDKLDVNGVIVIVLMVVVAVMNMVTALLILILERSNMIGLVKALGMTDFSVRKVFLLVSLRLTGKGLLWGNVAGIGLCLVQYYFRIARLESETYYVDYVAVDLNWLYYVLVNTGTFLVCCLVLYLPTILVTRLTPIRTLKFD